MDCPVSVVVHAGAGYHSKSNESKYNKVCFEACEAAQEALLVGKSAIESACCAVVCLENDELTNAGTGSNLSFNGLAECDAGIMCGNSMRFAAVGAIRDIQNPILVARLMLEDQIQSPTSSLGRVKPCVLFGDGARQWAFSNHPTIIQPSALVTKSSLSKWNKYRSWLNPQENKQTINSSPRLPRKQPKIYDKTSLDTVGAVCVDKQGNIAAAVSSGGVALKHEGRIGQASIYGCGCWAEKTVQSAVLGVATSGTGEQLIRTQLAQRICEKIAANTTELTPDLLTSAFKENFLNSRFLLNEEGLAGAVGIYYPPESNFVEILVGHTTNSMSLSYFVENAMSNPRAYVSRKSRSKPLCVDVVACRV